MNSENRRFEELDSLRGIAAFAVILYHGFMLTLWSSQDHSKIKEIILKLFSYFPFTILDAGHQAVIFFFLLSGFVLALPFLRKNDLQYWPFLIRRFCRIYIPYLAAIFCGFLMRIFFSNGSVGAGLWGVPINWEAIKTHLLLISMLDQNAFDPVVWSLVHEMRISIIFPFIMFCVIKYDWRIVLYHGIVLSFCGILLHASFGLVNGFTNFFDTLRYILIFIVGALIAKHREQLILKFRSMHFILKIILFILAYYCYCYPGELAKTVGGGDFFNGYLSEWFITIGGIIFVVFALSEKNFSRLLLLKPILFTGKISYSLYLYHLIFFLTWISLSQNYLWMTRSIIWGGTLASTLIVSICSYYLIEVQSIKLGRYLTNLKREKTTNLTKVQGLNNID